MFGKIGTFVRGNNLKRVIKTNKIHLGAILLAMAGTVLIPAYSKSNTRVPILATDISVDLEESDAICLDTKDADIRDILLGLAQDSGVNLILDDSVQGVLTISLSDVSSTEAIGLILHTNGFIVQKVGDSIVAATPEELKNILPPISEIIALKHAAASDLKQALSEVASDQASIQVDERTNSLIITGTASGIHTLGQAIGLLDVEASSGPGTATSIRVFSLEHAQASVIQALVSTLCSSAGKIQVDDRTNSLIVTDEVTIIEQLTKAIELLDIPSSYDDAGNEKTVELYTRVFRLSYIDGNAFKDVLQEILSPDGKIQAFVRQKDSIIPAQPENMGLYSDSGRGGSRDERITVEQKWSDILIITDTADVIERVEKLISELDAEPAQVMIEARMVEISLTNIGDIGIDWQAKHSPSGSTLETAFPTANNRGLALQIGTLSTQHFQDILLKIQALEISGQARLISNPSVITLDNELAQMIVADRIPIPTTYESQFRATTSYEFINVGIILTVIPHITEDGNILMDAMPEVNSIKGWTSGENPQPIISSRTTHTRVRVKDGETFVISGLIKDEEHETESRVPILCGIPFLGRFFRSKSTDSVRTDLMVFITPRICEDGL